MDALTIANKALTMAAVAQTQIEEHERTCAQRWGIVTKIGLVIFIQLLAVLWMLIYDKIS